LVFINLPENYDKKSNQDSILQLLRRLDLPGFALFAGASMQLLMALNWGGQIYAWSSSTIIGLFCGSSATLIVFIFWEHRQGMEAMIPLSLISRRVVWVSCMNYASFSGCVFVSTYFLPIYFQAVRNASPTMSGVDILPTIIPNILLSVLAGIAIGRVGYYLPFGVASACLNIISAALLTTLTPTSSTGVWVGFQIIQGCGRGLGFQVPVTAVQNNTPKELVSVATALVTFFMNMGAAIAVSLGETVFSTELVKYLAKDAPSVDAEAVVVAGSSAFREVVPADLLPEVLQAYCKAITRVLVMAAGIGGGQLLFSFGTGWVNVKKKKEENKKDEENEAGESK
jgi:Fungal trichothecene efflux pump (TRI12)